jgi:hypothetical protein
MNERMSVIGQSDPVVSAYVPRATKGIHHTSPAATYNRNRGLSCFIQTHSVNWRG